ncbi:MAG: RNA polymerase sigma factor [Myxococcota bacterium]
MPPSSPSPHVRNEPSDAELLRRIAARATDGEVAKRAQALFYQRHVRYLYGVVLRMHQPTLALASIHPEDLVQDTFRRAFERAHTYDPADAIEPESQSRRSRAWMGRIASRLITDALRRPTELASSPLVEQASHESLRESGPPSSRRRGRLQLVCGALDQLSDREQDVLCITFASRRCTRRQERGISGFPTMCPPSLQHGGARAMKTSVRFAAAFTSRGELLPTTSEEVGRAEESGAQFEGELPGALQVFDGQQAPSRPAPVSARASEEDKLVQLDRERHRRVSKGWFGYAAAGVLGAAAASVFWVWFGSRSGPRQPCAHHRADGSESLYRLRVSSLALSPAGRELRDRERWGALELCVRAGTAEARCVAANAGA